MAAPAQDAFGLIFQLAPLPAHDFWTDGKHRRIAAGPAATLSIIDLSGGVSSEVPDPFDSLGLCIPRAALDAFTAEASISRIGALEVPEMWVTRDETIARLAGPLVCAMEDDEAANPLLVDHLVLALMSHVTARYGGVARAPVAGSGGLAPWQERRAKELLDGQGDAVSLSCVARECRISVAHFARAFKRSTGVTPHGWLQRQRIERAMGLLGQSTDTLAEIAATLGFADQSHFTKVFAQIVGLTPAAWQRQRAIH